MLYFVSHKYKPGITHEDQKSILEIWNRFEPPAGFETTMHTFSADGRMFGFVESDSFAKVTEVCALWAGVYLDYEIVPVMLVEEWQPLIEKAIAQREG